MRAVENFLFSPFKANSNKKTSTTKKEGLDANGKLKPGYRFGKGGRIVKSKS